MKRGFHIERDRRHMANSVQRAGMVFGYARVSTADQKLDMQLAALERAGVPAKNIYVETVSGASKRRPALEKLLKALRPGDTLIVWKIDRVGRKTLQILGLLAQFRERKIEFRSLTEPIDFSTPIGEAMVSIQATMAQLERSLIAERTRVGIASHKERGGRYGPEIKFDLPAALRHLRKHGNLSDAARHVGVSRQTLRHHVIKDPKLLALVRQKKR